MSMKELDRKIDDSLLQFFKYLLLDIILSICLLAIHRIEGIVILVPILLCTFLSTYDWMDRINYMKQQKRELKEVEE